jgi:hypothetical protein
MVSIPSDILDCVEVGDVLAVTGGTYRTKTAVFHSWPPNGNGTKVYVIIDDEKRLVNVSSLDFEGLYEQKGMYNDEQRNIPENSIINELQEKISKLEITVAELKATVDHLVRERSEEN